MTEQTHERSNSNTPRLPRGHRIRKRRKKKKAALEAFRVHRPGLGCTEAQELLLCTLRPQNRTHESTDAISSIQKPHSLLQQRPGVRYSNGAQLSTDDGSSDISIVPKGGLIGLIKA